MPYTFDEGLFAYFSLIPLVLGMGIVLYFAPPPKWQAVKSQEAAAQQEMVDIDIDAPESDR